MRLFLGRFFVSFIVWPRFSVGMHLRSLSWHCWHGEGLLCSSQTAHVTQKRTSLKKIKVCQKIRHETLSSLVTQFVRSHVSQARKKSTKIKFLGPETARWGGGLPREGVVAENFVPALETLSSLGFEERNPGCPGNFAGMSRTPGGVQKVCAKKTSCAFFVP